MSAFDETQVKRDGDGKFTEKPAAAESGVDLHEQAPPAAVSAQSFAHAASEAAFEAAERELGELLRGIQDAKVRHRLAGAVADLDAQGAGASRIVMTEFEADDDASGTITLGDVLNADGEVVDSFGGEVQWPVGEGSDPLLSDLTADDDAYEVDVNKVRTWAARPENCRPVTSAHALWRASDAVKEKACSTAMRNAGEMVRTHIPNARYLVVTEDTDADADGEMTVVEIQDAGGDTIYEPFSYSEEPTSLQARFDDDLDDSVRAAGRDWDARIDLDELVPRG